MQQTQSLPQAPRWTRQEWIARTKELFSSAASHDANYENAAVRIGQYHAGAEVWAWDNLGSPALYGIWRDCWRLTQFVEPHDIPSHDGVKASISFRGANQALLAEGVVIGQADPQAQVSAGATPAVKLYSAAVAAVADAAKV